MRLTRPIASCVAAVAALGAAVLLIRLQGQPQVPEGAAPVDAPVPALIEEEARLAGLEGSPAAAAPVGERIEASGLATASAVGTFDAEASTPLAARWIRGRVLLPGGKPAGGALVTLLEMRDGQGLSSGRHTLAKADGLGAFEIAVPPWSWQQVVHLSARRRGSRPFSKALQIDSFALGKRHELTLEVGSVLGGRVLRGGAALEGVHVNVDVAYGVPGIYGAGPESWWANGRMERKHGSTQTDANGYFRIAGLSAAVHRVHLHEPGTPPSRRGDHVFSIEAPDSRVYDVTGATLAVQVVSPTGAVEGARIVGALDDGRVEATSGLGAVELDVPPGATVSLSVEHPRAAATSQVVIAPPAGQWLEVTVPVQIVERPRLVVTMAGMGPRPLDAVGLRFCDLQGTKKASVRAVNSAAPDTFIVDEVPLEPGHYFVSLEPGDRGTEESYLFPAAKHLELPSAGEARIRFPLVMAGRCEIDVHSDSVKAWSGSMQLVDAEGQMRLQRWIHRSASSGGFDVAGGDFEIMSMESFSMGAGESPEPVISVEMRRLRHEQRQGDADGVFPAGTYTLRVTGEGHADWSQPVEILAGQTTTVDVPLKRAPTAEK